MKPQDSTCTGPVTVMTISKSLMSAIVEHQKVQPGITDLEVSAALALVADAIASATPDPTFFKKCLARQIWNG